MAETKLHKKRIYKALDDKEVSANQVRGAFSALLRRMNTQQPERLLKVANVLFDQAEQGNLNAINILFDRLDGRPIQQHEVTGEDGGTIKLEIINSALERLSHTVEKVRQSTESA